MASADVQTKVLSIHVLHGKVNDLGHLYDGCGEHSEINFVKLKRFLAEVQKNPPTLPQAVKQKEVYKVLDQLTALLRAVIYWPEIESMENEIKRNCSPETWTTYQIPRGIFPVLAKLMEIFQVLMKPTPDEHIDQQIPSDPSEVLRCEVNKINVDIRELGLNIKNYQSEISNMEDKILELKQKLNKMEENNESSGEFASEERLDCVKMLLQHVEQNCQKCLAQSEALLRKLSEANGFIQGLTEACTRQLCDGNRLEELEVKHQNISKVLNRMKHHAKECSLEKTQCLCCTLRQKMINERQRQGDSWDPHKCDCCKCRFLHQTRDVERILHSGPEKLEDYLLAYIL